MFNRLKWVPAALALIVMVSGQAMHSFADSKTIIKDDIRKLFDRTASCLAAMDAVINDIAAEHRAYKEKHGKAYGPEEQAKAVQEGSWVNGHYWRLNELRERLVLREIGSVSILNEGYKSFREAFKAKYDTAYDSLRVGNRFDTKKARQTVARCVSQLIPAMELELGRERGSRHDWMIF